jgi:hypothetical protein
MPDWLVVVAMVFVCAYTAWRAVWGRISLVEAFVCCIAATVVVVLAVVT